LRSYKAFFIHREARYLLQDVACKVRSGSSGHCTSSAGRELESSAAQ